jgi:PAS domain S-box-containing protein
MDMDYPIREVWVADASVVVQLLAKLITIWFCVRISKRLWGSKQWWIIWGVFLVSIAGSMGSRIILLSFVLGATDSFMYFLMQAVTPMIADISQLGAMGLLDRWLLRMESMPKIAFTLPDPAHISINSQSIVVDWDDAAEELFGYTAAEALGQPLTSLVVPEHLIHAHHTGITRFLLMGTGAIPKSSYNIEARHKSGEIFDVKLALSATWTLDAVTLHASVWRLRL